MRSGIYYKIRDRSPVEIPHGSAAANVNKMAGTSGKFDLDADAWFSEPCTEHVLVSDQYDFVISLIHFGEVGYREDADEGDALTDLKFTQ